jgi:hypothetical protein
VLTNNRYDDDDNEHTCVVTSNALASPLTSCSYHVPTGADARKRQHTGSNDFASSDSDHVRATTSSRASALVQLCSSSSSSDSDDVLDLTLSRRGHKSFALLLHAPASVGELIL